MPSVKNLMATTAKGTSVADAVAAAAAASAAAAGSPLVCLPEWNVGGGVCVLMPVLARLIGGVLPFGRVSAVYVPV